MTSFLTRISVGLLLDGGSVMTVLYTGGLRGEATSSFSKTFPSLADAGRFLGTIAISMEDGDDPTKEG